MSTSRMTQGGWVDRSALPRGANGRALCRRCMQEVPRGRYTFCSAECVHEWKLRSQPGYLRQQVLLRDRGVCALCRTDTLAAGRQLRYSRLARRQELLARWGLRTRTRKTLWDADHIVPVSEGGGECDLSNLRTLCLCCHSRATAALRTRRKRRTQEANLRPVNETAQPVRL